MLEFIGDFSASIYMTIAQIDYSIVFNTTIISLLLILFLSIILLTYFNENVIKCFFSLNYMQYYKPVLFYIISLSLTQLFNYQIDFATLFAEFAAIITLIKLIGLIDNKIGISFLQIIGGFAFIELVLSPKEFLDKAELELVISLLLSCFLILFFAQSRFKKAIVSYHNRITGGLVRLLTKTESSNPSD